MKACFTGHRYVKNNHNEAINKLIDKAIAYGVTEFLNGMAIGTDLLAAQILNQRNLSWIAVIPCQDQTEKWPSYLKQEYENIRVRAKSEIILADKYKSNCMAIRNQFMIDNSAILLSVYDESNKYGSGTKFTVEMAKKKGLIIFNYNPITGKFSEHLPEQQLTIF
jgi:uncharacterized phage-like protein YoqJ